MKKLHLICNAHLDPIWLWEWEEGASSALSTFRSAVNLANEFDYIFCHNEVTLYKWVEEYDPELFKSIQDLVKQGKWHIMGGWYLQPDCNMPSGESFVRQMLVGKEYFKEKFGVIPDAAINFDPFGHSFGLPQILKKCGYNSYMCCRPGSFELAIPDDFIWEGVDGTQVLCSRVSTHYNSPLGHAAEKIRGILKADKKETDVVLWGVGNHGGGPSRKDLADIKSLMAEEDVCILHSTPEEYFKDTANREYVHRGGVNLCMPGCYTSQVRIKQAHRRLENELFFTEKLCADAAGKGLIDYPHAELAEAEQDLLNAEFHDILPGSAIKKAEEYGLRLMNHGLEILNRLRARAFFALTKNQKRAAEGEFPIVVYNPHPYEVKAVVDVGFNLEDQNWSKTFTDIIAYDGKKPLKTQVIKEKSNLTLDWMKRIVFEATLKPMSVNRFDCKKRILEEKPTPPSLSGDFIFDNGSLKAVISRATGMLEDVQINGVSCVKKGTFAFEVYKDNEDPWAMSPAQRVRLAGDRCGEFLPCNQAENLYHSGELSEQVDYIRITEDGPVMTSVEVMLCYGSSLLRVEYVFYKNHNYFDINCDMLFAEKNRLVKMRVPFANGEIVNDIAYGREPVKGDGHEAVMHKYTGVKGENACAYLINNGTYGMSAEGSDVLVTLIRGCCYSAHPIEDRPLIPGNRYTERIDQGERSFSFRLALGTEALEGEVDALAQQFNEVPLALSVFPDGSADSTFAPAVTVSNNAVLLSCFKRSKNGAYVARLFNNHGYSACASVTVFDRRLELAFKPFEIKTVVLDGSELREELFIVI